jgi:uncharacterized membrane protein
MTAQRWWVRFAARWLARIDGVKGQVQMFSLAVTAFSTFSIMLQGFGLGYLVAPLGFVSFWIFFLYTYGYNEGGVRNQVGRDRQDLSNNFSDPDKLINFYIASKLHAHIAHELQRDEPRPYEEIVADMQADAQEEWSALRDGVPIEQVVNGDGPD